MYAILLYSVCIDMYYQRIYPLRMDSSTSLSSSIETPFFALSAIQYTALPACLYNCQQSRQKRLGEAIYSLIKQYAVLIDLMTNQSISAIISPSVLLFSVASASPSLSLRGKASPPCGPVREI